MSTARPHILSALVLVCSLLSACSAPHDENAVDATTTSIADQLRGSVPVEAADPERCDPIGGEHCMLPFPNDYFTVRDDDTATGRRVEIDPASMPHNADGAPIDPTEVNRNDGFSPGASLLTLFPGLDAVQSDLPPSTDIGASLRESAPIVILDTVTRKRHPYWTEMDAGTEDPESRVLFIRPAVNFEEGHRYVVAVRSLRDSGGTALVPSQAFQAFRDRLDTRNPLIEARRPAMNRIFDQLEEGGVRRGDLLLAWSFTVASERSLSERVLHMRDTTFDGLADRAPAFTVDRVEERSAGPIRRIVRGTFEAPNFLTGAGGPGSTMNNGHDWRDDPKPDAIGVRRARFVCVLPATKRGADGAVVPSRLSLYGHGLLGSAEEVVSSGSLFAGESNTTFCGADWIGMASEDLPNVSRTLQDLSAFRSVADRLQQGLLEVLILGRLMIHQQGVASDPAFQDGDGAVLIDPSNLVFLGNSQGGILGGAATALAQDWTRAVLGVPAMNYSVLLERSVDFDPFASTLATAYPNAADRQLAVTLIQMLWDRGENNGYAHHITDNPYPDTPEHEVLLFEALGDHQVANIQTEVLARTVGAPVRAPALAPGRSADEQPFWDIAHIPELPHDGSALVVWDFGTPVPPPDNRPNRAGADPHGLGAAVPEVRRMASWFLAPPGTLIDVCDAGPCRTT